MGGTRREGCLPSTPAADRYTYSLIMDQSAAPRLLLIRKVFPAQRKNAIKHSKKGNLRSRTDLKTCGSLLRRLRGTLLGTQKKSEQSERIRKRKRGELSGFWAGRIMLHLLWFWDTVEEEWMLKGNFSLATQIWAPGTADAVITPPSCEPRMCCSLCYSESPGSQIQNLITRPLRKSSSACSCAVLKLKWVFV